MKKIVIPTTDGRLVETVEGVLSLPPPPPKKPGPNAGKKFPAVHRKPPVEKRQWAGHRKKSDTIPGYRYWWGRQLSQLWSALPKESRPGKKTGTPNGIPKAIADVLWAKAKEKAKVHMANIKKINPSLADDRAEKAMLATLEILESPMHQELKLKAARQVLEWTAAKPVAKSEVTVNAAEAWLASIAEQVKDDQG